MQATHGVWCHARTWRTRCPRCKADVFFFSWSCGSNVSFDRLGDPWPIHACLSSRTATMRPAPARHR
ncbi:MAG: hypothetical protein HC911_15375 [Chloroflexaceae bacterium]|nr:hypothetical protein [Chloroflexaceae bacterium]